MNGIQIALEVLAQAGVRHLFGNPGTTELPLNVAAGEDPRFAYYFGLHEIPVMGMADGYAMATRQLAVVNLHVACGLGNAMGMLYNAFIEGTPLLVTTGDQDRRLLTGAPVLAGDMVSMAKPCTKWASAVHRLEDLPDLLCQAIQAALTPPTGPVFLSLPLDLQLELADGLKPRAPLRLDTRIRPPRAALEAAANQLRLATRPVLVAGSRVTESGASDQLARLAERCGAPIYSEATPSHGRLPVSPQHPLYAGPLSPWASDVQTQLADYDLILAVGQNMMRWYIHESIERTVFPSSASLIHLDAHPLEIGRNYPIDLGVWGDLSESLTELNRLLEDSADGSESHVIESARARRDERLDREVKRIRAQRKHIRAEVESDRHLPHLTAKGLMGALAEAVPRDVTIVEEAITTHQNLFEHLEVVQQPEQFFAHRGWSLGWGIGCALGVRLAWPERPVLGLIGDGAAMYGIQGLWSAAHHRIPVVFVIANNRQYQILKQCGDRLSMPELRAPNCPGLNLDHPAPDFVQLAAGLGVSASRVHSAEPLRQSVAAAFERNEPVLIEAMIQ